MVKKIRSILWRILGVDYQQTLNKLDFTLLKDDQFTNKGTGTYDNGAKVLRWSHSFLTIGKYCSIANGVTFIVDEGFHNSSEITNYPFINNLTTDEKLITIRENINQKRGIKIGNDVWIGLNSMILPGVVIGNGVTIAAGSVVNKDIPDYAVVGGIPAKIIKMKYSDLVIQKLINIAWWDWNASDLHMRKGDFYLPIQKFIDKYAN